ncbi:hypothetical protein HMPREF0201_02068 [Cedecea davisae DSM 4568]|uniref:Uncharacterized protein n=1 Tax=Cedecea davisae DSM 4568 TaxID=566551 RepID=S3ISR9_9ENTR|nr:hypothetical protein HMPREF0201_02068 [Cedecea davisae DSM 4568]
MGDTESIERRSKNDNQYPGWGDVKPGKQLREMKLKIEPLIAVWEANHDAPANL